MYDRFGEFLSILALIQFSHEQHIGTSLCECDNCSMPILSYYCVNLEVSETPAVSFYRTFTDANTIRYGYLVIENEFDNFDNFDNMYIYILNRFLIKK